MKQLRYRLYTEDKARGLVARVVAQSFSTFTLTPNTGYWQGKPEPSLTIELIVADNRTTRAAVRRLAETLNTLNDQTAVLVTREPVQSALITERAPLGQSTARDKYESFEPESTRLSRLYQSVANMPVR